MQPSTRIVRELRTIHPGLFAEWDNRRKRWVIKKYDKGVNSDIGKPAIILVVENQDGGYAPIDQRIFDELRRQRRTAERRLNELCFEMEEADRRREEIGERDFDDMVAAEIATLRRQYY